MAENIYFVINCVSLKESYFFKLGKLLDLLEEDDDVQDVYNYCENLK